MMEEEEEEDVGDSDDLWEVVEEELNDAGDDGEG